MNQRIADTLGLTAAILTQTPVTFAYTDADGVQSIRTGKVKGIDRCSNGNTVVRTFDLNRNEPRCFDFTRVRDVVPASIAVPVVVVL